jgi:hypothetical protein
LNAAGVTPSRPPVAAAAAKSANAAPGAGLVQTTGKRKRYNSADAVTDADRATNDVYREFFLEAPILHRVQRQSGHSQQVFRDILRALSKGKTEQTHYQCVVVDRNVHEPARAAEFAKAVTLVLTNEEVDDINLQRLMARPDMIAHFRAEDNVPAPVRAAAREEPARSAQNLLSVLPLAIGVPVMLCGPTPASKRCDRHPDRQHFLQATRRRRRRRIFAEYTGRLAISGLPGSVLINPVSSSWRNNRDHSGVQFSRRQLPLRVCYAMTVHKAHGQTLQRIVLDQSGHASGEDECRNCLRRIVSRTPLGGPRHHTNGV